MRVEFMSEVGKINTLILKYIDRWGIQVMLLCYFVFHVWSAWLVL
jgi:hypothetical protein